ncbi:MAG: MnhB domain-containing protein [Haloferacaceae archaeon]
MSDDASAPANEDAAVAESHASGGVDRSTTIVARTVVRIAVPIILVTAISLLLQGHNLPGGGFIGAVLTATAFVLVYVIFGLDYLQTTILDRRDEADDGMVGVYRWLFALGLALAAGSGLVPVLFDVPFLTQAVVFVEHLPLYGELEVASAFAFDLGVYFTVVGALLTIIAEVGAE